MKSVFRLLPVLFLLALSGYLPGVRAETCRANIGQTTVNIPNIKYLPTLPVNTQMTSAMADNGSGIPFSCDLQLPTASAKRIVYKQLKTGGSPVVINGQHRLPQRHRRHRLLAQLSVRGRPDARYRRQPLRGRRVGGGVRQRNASGADDAAANHGQDRGDLL